MGCWGISAADSFFRGSTLGGVVPSWCEVYQQLGSVASVEDKKAPKGAPPNQRFAIQLSLTAYRRTLVHIQTLLRWDPLARLSDCLKLYV
jgi:hypothetical protein